MDKKLGTFSEDKGYMKLLKEKRKRLLQRQKIYREKHRQKLNQYFKERYLELKSVKSA